MVRVICLVIGYLFGLFQTSYLYGRYKGVDIRKSGSGNAGTTNALRTLGPKAGAITLVGDVTKCILAVLVTWLIFRGAHPELFPLLKIYTAAGVILGHDFPFYLGFKGGKGIAATGGMVIAFGDWRLVALGLFIMLGIVLTTHYVSLASMVTATWFTVSVMILTYMGRYTMAAGPLAEMNILLILLTLLAIYGHRGNIQRLLQGRERKTYLIKRK